MDWTGKGCLVVCFLKILKGFQAVQSLRQKLQQQGDSPSENMKSLSTLSNQEIVEFIQKKKQSEIPEYDDTDDET